MGLLDQERMAAAAKLLSTIDGVSSELLPGRFKGSWLRLQLRFEANGQIGSVVTDSDVPELYELVIFEAGGDKLFEKLTSGRVVQTRC